MMLLSFNVTVFKRQAYTTKLMIPSDKRHPVTINVVIYKKFLHYMCISHEIDQLQGILFNKTRLLKRLQSHRSMLRCDVKEKCTKKTMNGLMQNMNGLLLVNTNLTPVDTRCFQLVEKDYLLPIV